MEDFSFDAEKNDLSIKKSLFVIVKLLFLMPEVTLWIEVTIKEIIFEIQKSYHIAYF